MFDNLINQLKILSEKIPVSLFALIGGFIEEILAPIPSPLIMSIVGTVLYVQQKNFLILIVVCLLSAVGKTFGAWIIYVISDKAEDFAMDKFDKWIGVTHEDIESMGSYFNKTWKDDFLLIFLRAFPLIPGAPIAVLCGVIKLNMKTYIRSTFIGTFLRSFMYGFISYSGLANYQLIVNSINSLELVGKIIFIVLVVALIVWVYFLRKNGGIHNWIQKYIVKKQMH